MHRYIGTDMVFTGPTALGQEAGEKVSLEAVSIQPLPPLRPPGALHRGESFAYSLI